jgi:hypothetical protein
MHSGQAKISLLDFISNGLLGAKARCAPVVPLGSWGNDGSPRASRPTSSISPRQDRFLRKSVKIVDFTLFGSKFVLTPQLRPDFPNLTPETHFFGVRGG